MDWSHSLFESLIWLGKAFIFSLIGLTILVFLLGRFTSWGRQFRLITWDYFNPRRSKLPFAWMALLILMTLFEVRLNILFSFWYNGFYSSMQSLDISAFWFMLLIFAILASIQVGRVLLNYYLRQAFLIRWRIWMTQRLIGNWLGNQAYYRSQYLSGSADNPDQRVQQDIESFVSSSLTLSMGLLNAVVSLFSFSLILWNLSGTLTLLGHEIPRAMIFIVYIYVITATVFALKVGRPLIRLNFLNEQFSANFRYALIRLREYGESIAFYRGERVEEITLLSRFRDVIGNYWDIVFRSLKFQGFNLVISQVAVIFPIVIQAPRLFSKQITLGDVIQTAQSFGEVETALSFFRTSYDDFASYRAVINRISGFIDSIESCNRLSTPSIQADGTYFEVRSLNVRTPSSKLLLENLNLTLDQPSSLLIRGKSGIGKTTLLRAIAGLWPYAEGTIIFPSDRLSLFLPQKPYLPLGTLRSAIHYPGQPQDNAPIREILSKCHLSHLIPRLDDEEDWTRILSLGEQQRLAIGRVLLNRPQVVFLDEASSAMDEGLELAMYQLLRESLPDSILISVGHRSSLINFHTKELDILGEGKWELHNLLTKQND